MKTSHVLGVSMSVLVATATGIAQAATVESVNRQIRGLNDRLSNYENKFRVNGFASVGATFSDEETEYNRINNETNFRRNTRAGIQMTFNMDSQSSVVTQLVARGTNDFETNMEWAYFKHQFTPSLTTKIGRFRAPYYMLSEYLDVGYAVPWATMPQETYTALDAFANMDGIDLTYGMDIGDMIGTVQLAYGRVDEEQIQLDDLVSVGFTLAGDAWQTRLAYSQANTISQFGGVELYGDDQPTVGSFASLGFTYDPGDMYIAAETTVLEVDGSIVDATASYATFGYRMGAWLPHLTYAVTESTDDEDRDIDVAVDHQLALNGLDRTTAAAVGAVDPTAPVSATNPSILAATTAGVQDSVNAYTANFNRNTQRIGVGARWDYSSGVAIKFQYDMITTDDAPGLFDGTSYVAAAAANDEPDSTNIFTISVDTVF